MKLNNVICKFPDEMVSNDTKKSFDFAQKFASAIWSEWEYKYDAMYSQIQTNRAYAKGEQDISHCKKNIARNYIKEEFLHVDWNDKLNLLPTILRNFYNSVDMDELTPVVKAIDPDAVAIKDKRKSEKLKLFYAKDFINEVAQQNGGQSPIPLDSIPQSKEQVDLEEQTADPLKIETAEELIIEAVARENFFHLIQREALEEAVETNYIIGKVDTCPIEGIKMNLIKVENFIHGKTSNRYFSDCPYYGEVKKITVGEFKNIAKQSGLSFTDEEIRKMANKSTLSELTETDEIKVLFYAFRTYFQNVYKKKINKTTKSLKIIDRSKDVGTENEYNPKGESDISEKVVDNYNVWFEGIMVLDADKTVIKHQLVKNMPEHQGKILPPYIVFKPRHKSIVEEVIPRINAIQELRYRILHFRNTLRGNITEIDPDMIANISLGNDKLSPKEVLSMYFTMSLAFRKTKDEDGEFINQNRPLQEMDSGIPRALIELTNQFITEVQLLNQSFGLVQYEQAKPNPKTMGEMEMYRFSDNTSMRDYINALYQWSINCYQSVSSRINDAFEWKNVREKFIDIIGTDDVEVIEEFRKNRGNHFFGIYVDYIPNAEEKAMIQQSVNQYVANGVLDPLDALEITNIKNRKRALAMLRLRLMAKQKELQAAKEAEYQQQIGVGVATSNAAAENKAKLLQLEYQLRAQENEVKFQQQAWLAIKNGEVKIATETQSAQAKLQAAQWASQSTAELTKFKKDADADIMRERLDKSLYNQQQAIKLRKGEINDVNETSSPEIDLSTI